MHCGNPFNLREEHLKRQIEVLDQYIWWTLDRVYYYWKIMQWRGRAGGNRETLGHSVKQKMLFQEITQVPI